MLIEVFVTENEVFPEKGWNDFVVVILTWWHDALINLIQSEQNGTEQAFEFMDGPLSVKAIKMSENVLELQFIKERRETEEIFFTVNTRITEFKKALLKSVDELLAELRRKNWQTDDVKELEKKHSFLNAF